MNDDDDDENKYVCILQAMHKIECKSIEFLTSNYKMRKFIFIFLDFLWILTLKEMCSWVAFMESSLKHALFKVITLL